MNQRVPVLATMQDHAAYLSRTHDFQADIEILSTSDLIGTILETIMLATNMRFAAVARVTADRWVTCRSVDEVNFGLAPGDEIEIDSTFCESVRVSGQRVMFNDVTTDDVYLNHPIAAKFGIVSYASIPIHRRDGSFFGTLCAIDTEPRDVKNPRAVAMLEMFANSISRSLEAEEQLIAQQKLIDSEKQLVRIQEEFVAILGHDLRNPVAAFAAGVRQLSREPRTDKSATIFPLLNTSLRRMNELIDNMMMHAKSRLGGGIRIASAPDAPVHDSLTHVVEEIRMAAPDSQIELHIGALTPVHCDANRIAQAVSNLLSNAVQHGGGNGPIHVNATTTESRLTITVSNEGGAISDDVMQNLFQPYKRGENATSSGLGLGLFIASSIAIAHEGTLDVACADGVTTFTLDVPVCAVGT